MVVDVQSTKSPIGYSESSVSTASITSAIFVVGGGTVRSSGTGSVFGQSGGHALPGLVHRVLEPGQFGAHTGSGRRGPPSPRTARLQVSKVRTRRQVVPGLSGSLCSAPNVTSNAKDTLHDAILSDVDINNDLGCKYPAHVCLKGRYDIDVRQTEMTRTLALWMELMA